MSGQGFAIPAGHKLALGIANLLGVETDKIAGLRLIIPADGIPVVEIRRFIVRPDELDAIFELIQRYPLTIGEPLVSHRRINPDLPASPPQ